MVMLVRILTRCQGVKEAIVASAPPPLLGAKLRGALLAALALGASGKTSLFFPSASWVQMSSLYYLSILRQEL